MSLIIFDGVKNKDKIPHLVFLIKSEHETRYCEIPTDERTARHILAHLEKHSLIDPKPVERGNDEIPSDED